VTPADLRKKAADLEARGDALLKAGKPDQAAKCYVDAEMYGAAAAEMERLQRLTQRGSKDRMVANAARLRMSQGADAVPDELVAKANAAGYTLRSLAEAVKCSHAVLSQARRGKRSLRRAIVEDIERLIGFPATRANWPGGIRD
jgi:transcriptional regulator with XRE-family HTH domain